MSETYIDPGHPGVWPGGESEDVREAYDRLLAENPVPKQRVVPARDLVRRGGRRG